MPEDSTLEQTAQVSDEIIERISAMDEVENVGAMLSSGTGSMLGMSGSGEDVTSVSMYILLKEDASTPVDELSRQISDACSNLGGEVTVSGSFDLGSMMTTLGGSRSQH